MASADISSTTKSGLDHSALPSFNLSMREWEARPGRIPSLDGLRCFSILVVLIGHFVLPTSMIGVSAFGVKVFFFISGFLISRLMYAEYKRTRQVNLRAFYARRIMRLYPVVLVYILIVASIIYFQSGRYSLNEIGAVFLYYVNYLEVFTAAAGGELLYPIGVLWSLSVEEHFYLLVPLAFVVFHSNPKRMFMVCLTICVVCLGIRLAYAHIWPELLQTNYIYKHSETRFDSIAFGVMLSSLMELGWGRALVRHLGSKTAFIVGCLGIILSFAFRDAFFQNTFRFTLQGLMLAPIIVSLVFVAPFPLFNRILNLKPIAWVGMLSYSIYVWHGGVQLFFHPLLDTQPSYLVGYWEVVLTFGLAVLSYYLVERPVLKWRDRLKHRDRAGKTTA